MCIRDSCNRTGRCTRLARARLVLREAHAVRARVLVCAAVGAVGAGEGGERAARVDDEVKPARWRANARVRAEVAERVHVALHLYPIWRHPPPVRVDAAPTPPGPSGAQET
eukprot:1585993-Prymnesium_polylepis.2